MKHFCLPFALLPLFAFPLHAAAQKTDTTRVATEQTDSSRYSLNEATVTATRLVFVTKKDTLIYDMDALGATKGDMLRDMINRMPGLELRNGRLYFKGRAVTRLLVNGYDFKRGDTTKALDNLPAYIIKSVKAYEGDTDQHRITGIDDGQKEQVVDVILRKEYLGTWTGNADLGYGTDDRYRYRLFANTFTQEMRISVYGGYTNTGQYQSASDYGDWSDNGGAGSSSGDTRYFMPGFSGMWHNKKKEGQTGYFRLEYGFDYDFRGHNDFQRSGAETYLDDNTSKFTLSRSYLKNDEKILRPNATVVWNAWKGFYAQVSAGYSHQKQTERGTSHNGTWTDDVEKAYESPLDSVLAHLATGFPEGETVNFTRSTNGYSQHQNTVYANYYLTQKLSQKNLRLSARGYTMNTNESCSSNNLTAYSYYQPTAAQMDPLYNRFSDKGSRNLYSQNFLDLNVPVPFFNTVRFTYGFEYTRTKTDNYGFRLERVGDLFADYDEYLNTFGTLPATADWRQIARDAEITLNSDKLSRNHWAELQLQYNKKHIYASVQNLVKFLHDELDYAKGDYTPLHPRRNATSYLLNSQFRYTTDSIGRFNFGYMFSRNPAGINNYVDIPDLSDPLNITLGSAAFGTISSHRASFSYDITLRSGRVFSLQTAYSKTNNTTATRATYDKATGVTTSQSVNVNGAWDYNSSLSFSSALGKKKRANFSLNASYNFSNVPNYSVATSGDPLLRNDKQHTAYLSGNVNVNYGKVYFGVNANVNYSRFKSDLENLSGSELAVAYYGANVTWKAPLDFDFKSNVSMRHYITSTARQFNNFRTVWNASITKSFLRDKSLALQLECSDILNQRSDNDVEQTATRRYWSDGKCVGRFFMLHVIYRFSTKKKG